MHYSSRFSITHESSITEKKHEKYSFKYFIFVIEIIHIIKRVHTAFNKEQLVNDQ